IDGKNLAILQNYVGWSDEWRWQRSRRAALSRRMAAGKPAHGRGARSRDEVTALYQGFRHDRHLRNAKQSYATARWLANLSTPVQAEHNTRSYGLCQCCLGANWPLPASARILPPS